ncbi:MAG: hypothetical protein IJ861_08390 [Clostridia bacterium]|nr:hypothetical protein [Clostridia bacterium]
MTEEEAQEYNRLVDEYNYLVRENEMLAAELEAGIDNCYTVTRNIGTVGNHAVSRVHFLADEISDADDIITRLLNLLTDVTQNYFLFKNLSEASKMMTKYNDEYYTKFAFYHELRRVTLGFVIGLDAHIVSDESMRKKVEKVYLKNTDYWLAYAAMSVMLWASDEQEAAYRAMNKAMTMDGYKSCVFYMLINLRFSRVDVARNWYITLLEKSDANNLGEEWQYVLHAYLVGAMRNDKALTDMATNYFKNMLAQTEATSADFNKKVADKGYTFAKNYITVTSEQYPTLKETCPEYSSMLELLSSMEKISVLAKYFDNIYQAEEDIDENLHEQIENVLYNLINDYDDEEFKVIKNMKYNEAVIAAKGDTGKANAKFNELYGSLGVKKTFGDLLLGWALSEDPRQTNIMVKKFSLSYLKDRIRNGMVRYFEESFQNMKEKYKIVITSVSELPPYETECNEISIEQTVADMEKEFDKRKLKFVMGDKLMKVFLVMLAAAVLILAVAGLTIGYEVFPVLLTLGIVLGIVSGFLVWRRWVDKVKALKEYCRLSVLKLKSAVDEMAAWRTLVRRGYSMLDDLKSSIDKF